MAQYVEATSARVWNYTYYPSGLVKTATDPKQNPATAFMYASSGDLQSVTDPLGHQTSYGTDGVGRVTSVTSPAGAVTSYLFDALDDVTRLVDPNGNTTSYTYDLLGEVASVRDPNGNTTTYTRPNTLNKLTVCDPLNNCTVTNYDVSGKKTDQTDRRGLKTVLTYDNLRRITKAVYNSNTQLGMPSRTLNVSYDPLDRPTSITDTGGGNGGGSAGNSINLMYDAVDEVQAEGTTYTSGYNACVGYTYDAAGRRTGTVENQNSSNWQNCQGTPYTYCYDPDDELTGMYSGAGVQCSGSALAALAYDNDGNRQSLTVSANGSSIVTGYGYDAGSRLTSQTYTAGANSLGSLNYTYDADDGVISETGSLASIKLPQSVNAIGYTATNQVSTWSNNSSNPDAASNLTTDPSNNATLTWDQRNMLSTVTGVPAGTFSLQYDAKGRRENDTGAYTGTNYYLDDKTTVVASNNVNGSTNTPYTYVTLPDGEVVSYNANGVTSVPIQDYLGSTIGLVGSSNTLQTQWSYEPFGAPTLSGTQTPYPFQFGGAQYDPTGYYGSYSPRLAHSLAGGTVPYTGQSVPGFGHSPGVALPSRSSDASTSREHAARLTMGESAELPPGAFDSGSPATGASGGDVFIQILASLNIIQDIIDLFGGGGSPTLTLPARDFRKAHLIASQFIGPARGIVADNARPQDGMEIFETEASWFKPTLTVGYPYDPGLVGAASNELPKGTRVTVIYGGRSINVPIVGTGPFATYSGTNTAIRPLRPHPTRRIDLSRNAFRKLVGSLAPGHVPVTVVVPTKNVEYP